MTSKQVMLTAAVVVMVSGLLSGCMQQAALTLDSPYPTRRVFAVAPFANESGSLFADGVTIADHLARQLEVVSNIDVIPVSRSLGAMESLSLDRVISPTDAKRLLKVLGVDALVTGAISDYDPYDPPKLGLILELYVNPHSGAQRMAANLRQLTRTASWSVKSKPSAPKTQAVTVISAYLDAASTPVRHAMQRYTYRRGGDVEDDGLRRWIPVQSQIDRTAGHLQRISMDLYSEFVGYEMTRRLLAAETSRLSANAVADAVP